MTDLFGNEEIRALSWKQPFASAMFCGKIETRIWGTSYRGKVLICTSKAAYNEAVLNICGASQFVNLMNVLKENADAMRTIDMDGFAVAIGTLIDCRPMTVYDERKTFVRYHPEKLMCHIYENVQAIEPFPWKGQQGWKILNDIEKQKIKLL